MILTAVAFGLVIGAAVGMLGGGGSVLAVPVFVYVLGQSVQEATTASLVVVTAGALAAGAGHHREEHVCWRHAATFTSAAVPGIALGTMAGDAVGGRLLITAFAGVMLVAAAATWRRATAGAEGAPGPPGSRDCPPLVVTRDLLAGAAIGLMTGFFGVGGGFLIVPTLAIALLFSMRLAIGTSLAIIAATSVIGLVVHLGFGRSIEPGVTMAMAAACAVGALASVSFAGRVPQRALGRGFAAVVTAVALYLLVSAAFLGGPMAA